MSALGAWLEERAREAGFDDAAVVPADVALPDLERVREAVAAGRLAPLPWMAETLDQRLDITKRLPWAKSVLVVVASYWTGDHEDHVDGGAAGLAGKAKVSRYAWGQDYHHIIRRKLRRVRKELIARAAADGLGDVRCAPFNDVDAVLDRAWAQAAGLGFIAKSSMLIHKKLGTWTFIGGLVTDLDLGPRTRPLVTDGCGSCTACLDACPTQAIVAPRVVDARKCLVMWNVEEATAPEGDAPGMTGHGWAVGCDVCQEVCPWNKFASPATDARYKPRSPKHVAFTPDDPPGDVSGTPMARPGQDVLPALAARALRRP